ncbi:trypsin-like peptidase domain-containing protein [Catenovulum sp. 2E275]|uniref:trypsin-like peptidase domain-containing protein n=1 Tax=Catenovulum sp. 2E275 TaxID=2980497 RepID=UPI0021D308D9|nr:trypsin-like peptidase domain-containing protein [Catenovulum sp. 2E275]MCU4675474.1 trypsin-like peptidase domain-containing protein [Catenovulum sp. 2E275]
MPQKLSSSLQFIFNTLAIALVITVLLFAVFPEFRQNNIIWQSLFADREPDRKPISYAKAVAKSAPAVVNIYTEGFEINQRFYNNKRAIQTLGSGVIVSENGFILTAEHVVKNAELIWVALQDGRTFVAQLIGSDPYTDLAVLYVQSDNLPVVPIDPNLTSQAGDLVLAIGNPYNLGQTITQGIVSATGRAGLSSNYADFIQMDAAINDGNSGGALVDSDGYLVGINSFNYASARQNNKAQGIFFAVPAKLALTILKKIATDGRVVRGYLGLSGKETYVQTNEDLITPVGILVTQLEPNGPADKAGIIANDIILEIDGQAIRSRTQTLDLIAETKPGTVLPVTILRKGVRMQLKVTISELPNYTPMTTQ